MNLKTLLLLAFFVIILVLSFEGGFYFGVNFQKPQNLISNTGQNPREISVSLNTGNWTTECPPSVTCLRMVGDTLQMATGGAAAKITPAVDLGFLKRYTTPLVTSDQGLIKEATISVKMVGRIAGIINNDTLTYQGETYDHYFSLLVENPKSRITSSPITGPYKDIVDNLKIYKRNSKTGELTTADVSDLKNGKMVEVYGVGDLVNGKTVERKIILLE